MGLRSMITLETVYNWLNSKEDEHVEFKEAKNQIHSVDVFEYCVALANEGGGHLVLGISPIIPRKPVGSRALMDTTEWKLKLYNELKLRIEIQELIVEGKRIVVLSIPPGPPERRFITKASIFSESVNRLCL